MWLPEPVYKSLPTIYAVMGVLFMLGVVYIGFDLPMGPVYIGVGILSVLMAIIVSTWRSKHRGKPGNKEPE